MRMVGATKLALIATATVAASITLPATAHADSFQFLSPSGNVGCQMATRDDGTGYAWCKIQDHTWVQPQGHCDVAYVPGSSSARAAPCFGAVMSQLFFTGQYAPATLGYGQTRTAGTITCDSEPSGVTCTDTGTGHFFRVSRESYQLG